MRRVSADRVRTFRPERMSGAGCLNEVMRIIGGRARGLTLYTPKGLTVRPTSDRVKEAVFDILPDMEGRSFLDLYAGSGNMGLEALSRGAFRVVFAEKNRTCIETIRRNLARLHTESSSEVIEASAEQALRRLSRRKKDFDVIFADPPYEKGYVADTLNLLRRWNSLLRDSGLLVLQHSVREEPGDDLTPFVLERRRRYGETKISFFKGGG
ncbi:MAG TPA: 16S rRNA (guanine(966)-N(2))-methyltransferase RsmD [Syntrophales bacterium]|nr:16S rRNA (guanine(966)-N(2))-methyltransferase RsmD [Syntrophales bacterium]HPN23625.1 16S rRNA (guanine(966)-N(2))-methyltransferase RsmD [Syntrophales bacterium]HQM27850.1 16S rRNA (guanine(966)-N(2))-methyltransferase RsmD [Syntrophales bacterium]